MNLYTRSARLISYSLNKFICVHNLYMSRRQQHGSSTKKQYKKQYKNANEY